MSSENIIYGFSRTRNWVAMICMKFPHFMSRGGAVGAHNG